MYYKSLSIYEYLNKYFLIYIMEIEDEVNIIDTGNIKPNVKKPLTEAQKRNSKS